VKKALIILLVICLWTGVFYSAYLVKMMKPEMWCRFQSNFWYCEVDK
jgi:hypothetical protein